MAISVEQLKLMARIGGAYRKEQEVVEYVDIAFGDPATGYNGYEVSPASLDQLFVIRFSLAASAAASFNFKTGVASGPLTAMKDYWGEAIGMVNIKGMLVKNHSDNPFAMSAGASPPNATAASIKVHGEMLDDALNCATDSPEMTLLAGEMTLLGFTITPTADPDGELEITNLSGSEIAYVDLIAVGKKA